MLLQNSNAIQLLAAALCAVLCGFAAVAEPELGIVARHQAALDLGTDLRLMCVAAHPDDEDGASLATYRKKYGYKTIALIATRGEGGQNETGPELYNELGVIRTHEMKRAARITGADLHFLDLHEFGYSKSRDESYAVWGEQEALRRMVRKIRETRPDVIITHHGPQGGHGHHQAVGKTLLEAFDAAADPARFPEQLAEGLEAWQPARLYRRGRGGGSVAETDVTELDPLRGATYAELAGRALAEHESQGMGMFVGRFTGRRRTSVYSLQKESPGGAAGGGTVPAPGGALFEGLMDRVSPEARRLSEAAVGSDAETSKARTLEYIAKQAGTSGPDAVRAGRLASKLAELRLRAQVSDPEAVPGQELAIEVRLDDFGVADAQSVTFSLAVSDWVPVTAPSPIEKDLGASQSAGATFTVRVPENQAVTVPHPEHLFDAHFLEAQFTVIARVACGATTVELRAPVLIDVAPAVSLEFVDAPYLLRKGVDDAARFDLLVTNHSPQARDVTVNLTPPAGFTLESNRLSVTLSAEGDQKVLPIVAKLADNLAPRDYVLGARVEGSGETAKGVARMVDLELPQDIRVGVVSSYDDTFMTTLERFHVPHAAIEIGDFTPERLDAFTTIILDIRAYLVRPDVVANNQALLDYVHRGGTMIVMYHKTYEWKPDFAPYPISVSRNRVTVEDAPLKLLVPDHALFNKPNVIVPADWDGWIQERGLYFPAKWDGRYTPLIHCADPGEDPPPGSCLIAQYGQGTYFYTALGWYRQLRELHPGTLRVFANMLAL